MSNTNFGFKSWLARLQSANKPTTIPVANKEGEMMALTRIRVELENVTTAIVMLGAMLEHFMSNSNKEALKAAVEADLKYMRDTAITAVDIP